MKIEHIGIYLNEVEKTKRIFRKVFFDKSRS